MIHSELLENIRKLAPGTKLRKALDEILTARLGALIFFIDDVKKYQHILQGGFRLDSTFVPQKLYELAKMDGAIVISEDATKILSANIHLVPDASIPTNETGTRHRTAQRVARQTEKLVVAISRRRNTITLYFKEVKYRVNEVSLQLTRVMQGLNMLKEYRENLDKMILQMDVEEFENRVHLFDVVSLIDKGIESLKMREEVRSFLAEIGVEGKLAAIHLEEIAGDLDDLLEVLIKDYSKKKLKDKDVTKLLGDLKNSKERGLVVIARALGFDTSNVGQLGVAKVTPRGYRMLKYVARMPMNISKNVVKTFKDMSHISLAKVADLKKVEGVGIRRANIITESINSIRSRITSGKSGSSKF